MFRLPNLLPTEPYLVEPIVTNPMTIITSYAHIEGLKCEVDPDNPSKIIIWAESPMTQVIIRKPRGNEVKVYLETYDKS